MIALAFILSQKSKIFASNAVEVSQSPLKKCGSSITSKNFKNTSENVGKSPQNGLMQKFNMEL
jgi:hypothetical protein